MTEQLLMMLRFRFGHPNEKLEYSSNHSNTRGKLWFYSKDEATNFNYDIADTNNFKSFKYTTKLLEKTETDRVKGILKNTTIAVALKYLHNF